VILIALFVVTFETAAISNTKEKPTTINNSPKKTTKVSTGPI